MLTFQGQATDVDIQAREILRMRDELDKILTKHTKQPFDRIREDTERDFFMSGAQAKDYGIVDEVIEKNPHGQVDSKNPLSKGEKTGE